MALEKVTKAAAVEGLPNNSSDPYQGILHDLARYLGALHRVDESVITKVPSQTKANN
ncbi:hypothetical protein [Peptostreptococcus russellii]|uniref:hypothetical protein n=1 Tax=Peptostreptococcus russellii TaxID=215200 RepID=UPI001474B5BE|nr:hypothetical protein [Peptostreptococcus russellii]